MQKKRARSTDDILASDEFWVWARITFIALCLVVGVALASGCAGSVHPASVRKASTSELRSVVTLVRNDYQPYCTAFALQRTSGRLVLVTAAHCLERVALHVGDEARYREAAAVSVGLGSAAVRLVDTGRDYAELAPREGHGLTPLRVGTSPREGAYLSSPSAFFGEATSGRVRVASVAPGGRFEFSGHITHGWSGSPALDARGRAVGVVIQCVTAGGVCAEGVIASEL